jgi:DUF4097 and DUF4098 domain-containing protein YvlB
MRRLVFSFAPLALVTVAAVGVGAAQDDVERISRTLPFNAGGTLHLKSFSGRVNISAADRQDVLIDAVRRAPRERLDHIKLEIRGGGDDIYIEANRRDSTWWRHNNVVETDFDIKVPRRTNVDVGVFSAGVTVLGVDGAHRVSGFSSRLAFDDVNGSVKAHTFSGPVEVHSREWREDQDVDIDTFSGNITMRIPDSARGSVIFHSFSGHLNSQLPLTLRDGGRRSLRAHLGGAADGGRLRFKTFSGSVQIDR